MSHTPGPWTYCPTNSGHMIAGGKPGYLAEIRDCGSGDVKANARLVAAAPDLLEACKTFAEWLDREDAGFVKSGNDRSTPEGEQKWREWYDDNLRICALAQKQARYAISKARGEA